MLGNFIAGKITLFVVIGLLLFGTHYYSYQQGWAKGYREGVSQQNHEYDKRLTDCQEQQKKVFEQEKAVLTAQLLDYRQKIQTAHKMEMHYLQQLKTLESHQQQLKRQLHDVTSQFIDEMGQLHALPTGFTNGFVQQVNAAFGVPTDSDTDTPSAQSTSRAVFTVKTRLRLSELTQPRVSHRHIKF